MSEQRTPVTELHQLCRADYAKGQSQRAAAELAPTYATAALALLGQVAVPSDLAVAIRVAQKMLAAYGDTSNFGEFGYAQAHGALSESLRILLRAVGAEPGEDQ